jgi:hypothetical protein
MTIGGVLENAVWDEGIRREQRLLRGLSSTARPLAELHSRNRPIRFVVVETRTFAWKPQLTADDRDQTILLPRGHAESLDAFSGRAARKVIALSRDHQTIRLALVLLAPRFDARATTSRLVLARALMTQAAQVAGRTTKLVLCAEDDTDPKTQSKVMTFVERLMSEPSGWRVPIQVKFGQRGFLQASRS